MPPRQLDSLPFDVFYQIAISLDDRDYINLSRTNRALRALMESELITRKIVEVPSSCHLLSRLGAKVNPRRENFHTARRRDQPRR